MENKLPNLYIIGAPKSGTTSVAYWLSTHPEIFFYTGGLGDVKAEPLYWAFDLKASYRVRSLEDYLRLFSEAKPEHKYIGEASVWYYVSKVALDNIEKNVESPKYIFCIRNPVDLVYSLWIMNIRLGTELITDDFLRAFYLSEKRRKGELIGVNTTIAKEPILLDYQYAGALGTHLERILQKIPRERLFVILLDDLKSNPDKVWAELVDFLGVKKIPTPPPPRKNVAKTFRNKAVHKLYLLFRELSERTYSFRKKIGLTNTGFGTFFHNLLLKPYKYKMPAEVRRELTEYFKGEIEKLERLLGRDLSAWKVTDAAAEKN